ncbi:MAG: alpha/beta fold hydrolase [Anaerolineae bacterium]|nr:alpha/beta fold hydrolase [Anaerolineae bacterium]
MLKQLASLMISMCLILLPGLDGDVQPKAEETLPYYEASECLFAAPADGLTECGYLIVLENRAEPDGRRVRLPVVIFESWSDNPEPDPVVFFDGGPGQSVVNLVGLFAGSPIREHRDLILFEQRGNDHAEPSLDCPEVNQALISNLAVAEPVDDEIGHVAEAADECQGRLTSENVANLSYYHSTVTAADFDDLREALGYETWNLYGISYGTRLAMFYMRDYPQSARSVVLDSIYPPMVDTYTQLIPDAIDAFGFLFDTCEQDPECHAAYPDLEPHFYQLVEDLNDEPIPFQVAGIDVLFSGDDLVAYIFNALYQSSAVPFLPFLIEEIYHGNSNVLPPISYSAIGQLTSFNWGKYYSVECYEEWPHNLPEEIAESRARNPQISFFIPFANDLAVCPVWGAGQASADADQPIVSDIPTLILSGEYDPITRPEYGRLAQETLSNAYRYEFTGLAHAISLDGCAREMMLEFLDDPDTPPASSCMEELQRSPFIIADDWYVTPAIYRMNVDLLGQPSYFHRGMLAFVLLFFIGEILLLPGNLLRAVRRGKSSPALARVARGLGVAVAVLGLVFWVGLLLVVHQTLQTDFIMVGFALPASCGWLFAVPYLVILPTVGLVVLLLVVWKHGYWTLVGRIQYTLLTLAALAFGFFNIYWGLMG